MSHPNPLEENYTNHTQAEKCEWCNEPVADRKDLHESKSGQLVCDGCIEGAEFCENCESFDHSIEWANDEMCQSCYESAGDYDWDMER